MKSLAFDLIASQPNVDGAFHGGGKYAKKIFLELVKQIDTKELTVYALYDSSKDFDEEISKCITNAVSIKLIDVCANSLASIMQKYNVDRFYTALPFSLIEYGFNDIVNTSVDIVVTIHGLRALEKPISFEALQYMTSFMEKAKTLAKIVLERRLLKREVNRFSSLVKYTNVITVSNHTKYSLLASMAEVDSKVNVFYSPDVTEFNDVSVDEKIVTFNESNYFLMVSGNRWLKNNLRSAVALDKLFSVRKELTQKVIITGVSNPEVYLKKLHNKDRFIFYPYVAESFLQVLYKNAYAFIYMTLNEGFGYPPLEAMKYGVPVITTPHTSIPEICGDAVLYADPYSTLEIMNRILSLSIEKGLYDELMERGNVKYSVIRGRQEQDLMKMINLLTR